jgi:hypothetical protein
MHYAHFECVNKKDNAFRFYRFEIAAGFFDDFHLTVVKGRIGTNGVVQQIASGPELAMFERLIRGAEERNLHGYDLIATNLPLWVDSELNASIAKIVARTKPKHHIQKRKALNRARLVLQDDASAVGNLWKVEELLKQLDPIKQRAFKRHSRHRQRPVPKDHPRMPHSADCTETRHESDQLMRDIVARLAFELLSDDPLAAESVMSGLSLPFPDEIDGTNVTFIRNKNDQILSMSVEQFIYDACLSGELPLSQATSMKLSKVGILTVHDLVRWGWRRLSDEAGISGAETHALIRACARYKIYFKMDEIHSAKTRFTA